MQRMFLTDRGRYKRGSIHDWPRATWVGFGSDWQQITMDLDALVEKLGIDEPITLPDGSVLIHITDPGTIQRLLRDLAAGDLPQTIRRGPGRPPKQREVSDGPQVPN